MEVVGLVDDRIGVVLEGGAASLPAGHCATPTSARRSATSCRSDAGGVIENNAVVTVQTQERRMHGLLPANCHL